MDLTEKDKQLVNEALNLGAAERLLVDYFVWRARFKKPPVALKRDEVTTALGPLFANYRAKVTAEFNTLPRGIFADPDGERTSEEHYFYMRPQYYALGFDNPAGEFLTKIRRASLLGKMIPGGVHEAMVDGLNNVSAILDRRSAGLSSRVAAAVRAQDGGFVPRKIAGTSELSNHAFGLAIDIDPPSNPHVKGPVIPLLNEVVKSKTGRDFDFGSSYSAGKTWSRVLTEDQRLNVTYLNAHAASVAVQDWLEENLGTYDQCLKEIAAGNQKNATTAARTAGQQAQFAINNERDLQLVQLLVQQVGRPTLGQWRLDGIQSLPYELAWALQEAFAGNPWFRWGQEYNSSKDSMHFELQAIVKNKDGAITPATLNPKVPHVRALEDVIPLTFLGTYSPGLDDFFASKEKLTTQPLLPLRTYR